jgi:hypothetical protein
LKLGVDASDSNHKLEARIIQYGRVCSSARNRIPADIRPSLEELAQKLISSGPHKVELTPRRVRALFDGAYLFDTTSARHVWEHQYYPQFWVPATSFAPGVLTKGKAVGSDDFAFLGTAKGNAKSTDRVLIFEKGPLEGLVRVEFKAAGKSGSPIYLVFID